MLILVLLNRCVSLNTTTIEHYDYSRRKRWAKRNKSIFLYPFDNGRLNNFRAMMGDSWQDWLSTSRTRSDGIHEVVSVKFLRSLDKGQLHWNVIDDAAEKEKQLAKIL